MTSRQFIWEGPLPLLNTPKFQTGATDQYTEVTSAMSLIYNALARGFNSIYLQAPHVPPASRADFLAYALAWTRVVQAHLTGAAAYAGPRISAVTGTPDALAVPPALSSALTDLQRHLSTALLSHNHHHHQQPPAYSAAPLLALLSTLQPALSAYLLHELDTLHSLTPYGSALDVMALVREDGSKAMGQLSLFADLPLLFLNNDATFEGGMHADYPPLWRPLRWLLLHVFTWRHWRWWKFATCDSYERPKALYCAGEVDDGVDG